MDVYVCASETSHCLMPRFLDPVCQGSFQAAPKRRLGSLMSHSIECLVSHHDFAPGRKELELDTPPRSMPCSGQ